jgi:hypothetical protein
METRMRTISRFTGLLAVLAVAATPALAADPPSDKPNRDDNPGVEHKPSDTPPSNQGTEHRPSETPVEGTEQKPATPGPSAGLPAKAKAYGRRCQDQSKKHSDAAEGTKGTPFSQCVTAMANLATDATDSPRKACKDLSRKHTEGEKGTPFSACVKQGAKLLSEQKRQDQG